MLLFNFGLKRPIKCFPFILRAEFATKYAEKIPSFENKESMKKHLEFEDKIDFLNLEQGAVVPTTKEE